METSHLSAEVQPAPSTEHTAWTRKEPSKGFFGQ